jgi:hypothetical protein
MEAPEGGAQGAARRKRGRGEGESAFGDTIGHQVDDKIEDPVEDTIGHLINSIDGISLIDSFCFHRKIRADCGETLEWRLQAGPPADFCVARFHDCFIPLVACRDDPRRAAPVGCVFRHAHHHAGRGPARIDT